MKLQSGKKREGMALLALGALGVVFGDIGTSPLYVFVALFGKNGQNLAVDQQSVYGIISLIIWSVIIVVAIKYVGFVMRINNGGEGGILALVALIKNSKIQFRPKWWLIGLGIVGVSLFYGDSAITPAISVLSAVEGLKLITPSFTDYVVPITVAILIGLFALQRYGTAVIGRLFGPIMLVWFVTLAVAGGWHVWHSPDVLAALSPIYAVQFVVASPVISFIAMAAIVLAITGAEALYADMGHFGRPPIARAWFLVVLPALLLCYMGQGVVLLQNPTLTASTFFHLFPAYLFIPAVILATVATLIASQSVISGAFSLTRQAVHLGFLPNMLVRHTSDKEAGQVFVPLVNMLLLVVVVGLVVGFGSSAALANAYGVAISGAILIDSILFIGLVLGTGRLTKWSAGLALLIFIPLELAFVLSNFSKITSGGWFPLVVAILIFLIVTTWIRGQTIVSRERQNIEGSLQDFVTELHHHESSIKRVPGQAIYIAHHAGFAPMALKASVERLQELHAHVIVVVVKFSNLAHVATADRAKFNALHYPDDGISYLELTYGYHDSPNVPRTLESIKIDKPEFRIDHDNVQYFVSLTKVTPTKRHNLLGWQRSLYLFMDRNRRSTSDHLHLPTDRTIDIEAPIEL